MPLDVGRVSHLIEQMHRSEDDAGDPIVVGKVLVTDGARGFTWEDNGSSSLPWYDLVTDFGAVCDNTTDDTTAVQDAVDAMAAAGGGICIVPGLTKITGVITMPDVDYVDAEAVTIGFWGTYPPPGVPSAIGSTPLNEGPGFRTTNANGAIFNGTSATGLDNFTNVSLLLRDLVIRSPANPTSHVIDALKIANIDFERVQVDAGSLDVGGYSLQTTATSFGIRLPRVDNGSLVRMRDVHVIGFYNGIQVSEHADLDGVFAWACRRPWVFEGSYHAAHLTRCGWYHCKQGIEFVAGPFTNPSYFTWTHCNIERADTGTWTQTGDDVVDASDYGNGRIEWHAVLANTGVVHTFVNGGATVYDLEIGEDPFGGAGFTLTIDDEGTPLATGATTLDFVGSGVVASGAGATKTITITSGSVSAATLDAHGVIGPLVIIDSPSTPIIFGDIVQTEAEDDLVYADLYD